MYSSFQGGHFLFSVETPLKAALAGPASCVGGDLKELPGQGTSASQVDGNSDMVPTCTCRGKT